jgi:hypothetical protein
VEVYLLQKLAGRCGAFSAAVANAALMTFGMYGFRNISARKIPANLIMASAGECLRFEKESFGALHQMLAGLDEHAKSEAWAEIEGALRGFESPSGFAGPCTLVVTAGRK